MTRAAIVVGAAGLTVTGLLWWGTADLSTGEDPDNRAAALVPPDGHRSLARDDDGTVQVAEDARITGAEMVVTSPPLVGGALTTLLDGDAADWRIWRNVTTSYAASADTPEQTTTVRRLTDEGIEQLAVYGAFTLVFDPPLLEMPADVHDGSAWGGAGDARADGEISYASDLAAATTGDEGCLQVTGHVDLRVGDQELQDIGIDEQWCPGSGVTGAGTAPGPTAFDGSTEPVSVQADADAAADWQVRPRPPVLADSVGDAAETGDVAALTLDIPPAAGADGGLVVASTPSRDVFGLTPAEGALVRAWVGHPGGTVTALGTSGEVTVTGSTTRGVDGYGPHGAWLWELRLSDVMVAPPMPVDADHLVVTSLGGDVDVVDPATGERAWHARMSDQVRVAPAADADRVVVGDVAGQVSLFSATSGRARWSVHGQPVQAVGLSDDTVVVLAGQHVVGYAGSDGHRLWARSVAGVLDGAVVDLGSTVVAATRDQTLGLDPSTGAIRWGAEGADDTVLVGAVVAQARGGRLVARDADGRTVADLGLEGLDGPVQLTPVAGGLYATDVHGQSVAVSR